MEKLIEFLKKEFTEGIQMFNTKSLAEDPMYTIYKKDGLIVEYCPIYEYIEVFGLSLKDFDRLNAEINGKEKEYEIIEGKKKNDIQQTKFR